MYFVIPTSDKLFDIQPLSVRTKSCKSYELILMRFSVEMLIIGTRHINS